MMRKDEILSCFLRYTDADCAARMAEQISKCEKEVVCEPRPAFAAELLEQFRWAEGKAKEALAAMMVYAMQPDSELHPAFPAIAGQMSELEFGLFEKILEQPDFPVLDFYFCLMQKEGLLSQLGKDEEVVLKSIDLAQRTTLFVPDDRYYLVQAGLDNLLRLGLIEIEMEPQKRSLTKLVDERWEQIYMTFEPAITAEAEQVRKARPHMARGEVRVSVGIIRTTTLGLLFGRAITE